MVNEDNYQDAQDSLYTEAERLILSPCFLRDDLIHSVPEYLKPEHFGEKSLGEVFKAIKVITGNNVQVNPFTVNKALPKEISEELGGEPYFVDLMEECTHIPDENTVIHYAKQIHDCYKKRELRRILEDSLANLISPKETSDKLIESLETSLFKLSEFQTQNKIISFSEGIELMLKKTDEAFKGTGTISTGFKAVDGIIGGLYPSDLYILAGRTAMGKTAFATNIAYNVAKEKAERKVLFFSLEMSADQLVGRIVAPEAKIPYSKIRKGLNPTDCAILDTAGRKLKELGIHIDDSPDVSVSDILTRSRQFKRKHHNLDLIIVDYLQLIEEKEKKTYSRYEEISKITRGLKKVAKELNVPVIALSQLSRDVEKREGNRPKLCDLRDSGSIEQDADGVMLVYRPGYYSENKDDKNNDKNVEINIAKNRNGMTEIVNLQFDGKFTKFSDLEQ